MGEWIGDAIDRAGSTLITWAVVILSTLVLGFLAGYWVGHGGVTDPVRTLRAFAMLPLLWLGNPEMFIAYGVAGVAWYLPPHYESRWFRLVFAVANLLTWFAVVYAVVVKTANGKFFQY